MKNLNNYCCICCIYCDCSGDAAGRDFACTDCRSVAFGRDYCTGSGGSSAAYVDDDAGSDVNGSCCNVADVYTYHRVKAAGDGVEIH